MKHMKMEQYLIMMFKSNSDKGGFFYLNGLCFNIQLCDQYHISISCYHLAGMNV